MGKEVPWDLDWGVDDDYNFIREGFNSKQFYTNEIVLFNVVNFLADHDLYHTLCYRGYRDFVPNKRRVKRLGKYRYIKDIIPYIFRYRYYNTQRELEMNENHAGLPLIHNQVRDCKVRRPFRVDLLYLISLKIGVPIGEFFKNRDKWIGQPTDFHNYDLLKKQKEVDDD